MEVKYFEGKTILITGVTGFLAKVFLEKLLRVQPKVEKVFLLIRAKNEKSLEERLNEEVFGMDLFQVLKEKFDNLNDFNFHVLAKIIPVSGDASQENLGIVDSDMRNDICRQIDIIINSSGATKFDERYDVALSTNTFGVIHILNFARKCPKLEGLLHVSTAFVHSPTAGVITETPLRMGETPEGAQVSHVSISTEKKIIEAKSKELETLDAEKKDATRVMMDLGSRRAKQHGWPNTYTFTKAMGEMILSEFKEHVRVIIIRPTAISSTYKQPFPGWIEGLRTIDSLFVAYGKGKIEFFFGDPQMIVDVIPCDMVVNCMMAAMAKHFDCNNINKPRDNQELVIYQVGSSRKNPINFEELACSFYEYLRMNPLSDYNGKPVKVHKTTFMSMDGFRRYHQVKYLPVLRISKVMDMIKMDGHPGSSYANAKRSLDHAMSLAHIYEPHGFSKGIFDDVNTETLRVESADGDEDTFGFDPRSINWEEYLVKIHFPGLVKYVIK